MLGNIFRNKHYGVFEQLVDRKFLMFLVDWFSKEDLSTLQLFNPKCQAAVRLLEIMVRFLLQRISSMDDVEFSEADKGLRPQELELIVRMLNSLIYELVEQNLFSSSLNQQLE